MGTATLKTRNVEKRTPHDSFLRKKKNASGGVEAKFLSCKECGIEFCTGDSCKIFDYDSFKRIAVSTVQTTSEPTQEQVSQEKKSLKKKRLNKGSKVKLRVNDTRPAITKNVPAKNVDKIISVKTNKKNLDPLIDKSKDNVRTIKDPPNRNIELKNNTGIRTKENAMKKHELSKKNT